MNLPESYNPDSDTTPSPSLRRGRVAAVLAASTAALALAVGASNVIGAKDHPKPTEVEVIDAYRRQYTGGEGVGCLFVTGSYHPDRDLGFGPRPLMHYDPTTNQFTVTPYEHVFDAQDNYVSDAPVSSGPINFDTAVTGDVLTFSYDAGDGRLHPNPGTAFVISQDCIKNVRPHIVAGQP